MSLGSSPRVWGQVDVTEELHLIHRIIPTRVGTSNPYFSQILTARDHPHACGDKKCYSPVNFQSWGSSPRVWGQAVNCISMIRTAGIIPTRVGTSLPSLPVKTHDRDHPHACGDKPCQFLLLETGKGSSPRVWGQVPRRFIFKQR